MSTPLFIVLVGIAFLAAVMAGVTASRRRRLMMRLRRQYGENPEQVWGLKNAEGFWAALHAAGPGDEAEGTLFDVDDLTWSDLDLDDIYGRVNACQSAVGDARLYAALRRLRLDDGAGAPAARRDALAKLFTEDEALCHKARYILAKLGRFDGDTLADAVFNADALRLRHVWLYALLGLSLLASIGLFFVHTVVATTVLLIFIALNFYVYSSARSKADGGFRAVRYLAAALTCARRLARLLQRQSPQTAAALRAHAARFGRYTVPIGILTLNNTLEDNIDFDPFCLVMLPLLAYARIAAALGGSGPHTLALYTLLGEIDLAQCTASYRQSLPLWCRPRYGEAPVLDCENLYHPMLDDPVPNTARFENDTLLTGSNASGKSTFIKALAIGCLTAQALNTCCATRFALRRGAVATSMAVADSVVDGDSYFVAEIKSMRRLMRLADSHLFCTFFIDEILKGTNTVERIAASAAVLRRLHGAACLCFAATHDIELTSILAGEYDNFHFRETVTDGGVGFDYKLKTGPSTTRNAILLLEQMSFPPIVTAGAQTLVERFEKTGSWADGPAG